MTEQEILEIVNHPEDKTYWVDHDHMMIFHAGFTENFNEQFSKGGYISNDAWLGKGFYSNVNPWFTHRSVYGQIMTLYSFEVRTQRSLSRTMITNPRIYKEVYEKEPSETFMADQIVKRFELMGKEAPEKIVRHFSDFSKRVLEKPETSLISSNSDDEGRKVMEVYPLLQKMGFKNLMYCSFNIGDGPSVVCYEPLKVLTPICTLKSSKKGKEYSCEFIRWDNEPIDDLSHKIEKLIMDSSKLGSIKQRFEEMYPDSAERANVLNEIVKRFSGDKFAELWIRRLK